MDLSTFQRRLSEQYARLRDLRAPENYPVYAIEHGLSAEEALEARKLLNASFRESAQADRRYWLVWIAAAAEVGYLYDGSEYWDSFGEAFPNWTRYGDRNRDRNQIRDWYVSFAKHYRGLTPSGPWARKFPIIAWPIIQAILPGYLQRQFSDHLFNLRFELARSEDLTLEEIGDLLITRYDGSSSRFEGFLQQRALTARIVLALSQEGGNEAFLPIEKSTLARITDDIDQLGSFGAQLRETRKVLRSARFINSEKPGYVAVPKQSSEARAKTERAERPRLVARLIDGDNWCLSFALPDLGGLLRRSGLSPHDALLSNLRYRPYGEASPWSPARGLFFFNGNHEQLVSTYPTTDISVFEFERPLQTNQTILLESLHFPLRVVRLLKLRADGAAFEVAGLHVRPSHTYLVVAIAPIDPALVAKIGLVPLRSTSPSAHLYRLDVPSVIGNVRIDALRALGLGYQLGVRAEPLGLSPRWGISNGALVFLDTEIPMFCVTSDVAVREYVIAIDGEPPVRAKPAPVGPTLISLDTLPIGPHRVAISAFGVASGGNLAAEELCLEVRTAMPWRQAIEGKAGVSLSIQPRGALLEQLIDGPARLHLIAPEQRMVAVAARFFGANGAQLHQVAIGKYQTPLSDERISALVIQKLTTDFQLECLERASRIEINVALDEYGSGHVTFEKEAEPVRWIRVSDKNIRLADDTEGSQQLNIERFDFESVDVSTVVAYEQCLAGVELRGNGGLFVATSNGRQYGVIATGMRRRLSGLSSLEMPIGLSKTSTHPTVILGALAHWHKVRRSTGPMAFIARDNAIHALERALAVNLCGTEWGAATERVLSNKMKLGDLYAKVYHSLGFASGIARFSWQYDVDEARAVAEFSRLMSVYRIPFNHELASHALKLAFEPHNVELNKAQSTELFDALRVAEPVVRGAYFARLATDVMSYAAAEGATG